LPYLNECIKNKPYAKRFAVIRKMAPGEEPLKRAYIIGKDEFKRVKTDLYHYDYFPFRLMQAMIRHPLVLEVDTFQLSES